MCEKSVNYVVLNRKGRPLVTSFLEYLWSGFFWAGQKGSLMAHWNRWTEVNLEFLKAPLKIPLRFQHSRYLNIQP